MNKFGMYLAMTSLAALMGCAGGDDRSGGGGGGIMLMDAGGGLPDAAPPPPMTMDASTMPPPPVGGCTIDVSTGLPALPSACLPRCAASTWTTIMGCSDLSCQTSALQGDSTPSTTLTLTASGMMDTLDLDCETCFNVMNNSCINDVCPTEFNAYLACSGMMGADCSSQDTALGACIMANDPAFRSCQNTRVPQCFAM